MKSMCKNDTDCSSAANSDIVVEYIRLIKKAVIKEV